MTETKQRRPVSAISYTGLNPEQLICIREITVGLELYTKKREFYSGHHILGKHFTIPFRLIFSSL